jgi:hypothetical protein
MEKPVENISGRAMIDPGWGLVFSRSRRTRAKLVDLSSQAMSSWTARACMGGSIPAVRRFFK